MSFPINKYKFYVNGRRVIAVSTFAGKSVRGIAACAEGDTFDLEKGKELAAAKCAAKIANKRLNRAFHNSHAAYLNYLDARSKLEQMDEYIEDSKFEFDAAIDHLHDLLARM